MMCMVSKTDPEGNLLLVLMRILAQGDGKKEQMKGVHIYPQEDKESCISIRIHRCCLTQKPNLCLNDTINSNELKSSPSTFLLLMATVTDGPCRPGPHSVQFCIKMQNMHNIMTICETGFKNCMLATILTILQKSVFKLVLK